MMLTIRKMPIGEKGMGSLRHANDNLPTAFKVIYRLSNPNSRNYPIPRIFYYMMTGKAPSEEVERAFDRVLTVIQNMIFKCIDIRCTVNCFHTYSDLSYGTSSAIGALKGPLHGGVNEAVFAIGWMMLKPKIMRSRGGS